jgi:hypothetical protein
VIELDSSNVFSVDQHRGHSGAPRWKDPNGHFASRDRGEFPDDARVDSVAHGGVSTIHSVVVEQDYLDAAVSSGMHSIDHVILLKSRRSERVT